MPPPFDLQCTFPRKCPFPFSGVDYRLMILISFDSGGRMAPLEKANSGGNLATTMRYLWIRVALFEKKLQRIVCHLVHEAEK